MGKRSNRVYATDLHSPTTLCCLRSARYTVGVSEKYGDFNRNLSSLMNLAAWIFLEKKKTTSTGRRAVHKVAEVSSERRIVQAEHDA